MIDITPPMPETPPQLTVVDMVRASARKNPDQEALICGDERLNWSDFDTRINRVANALIARGIGKGDNVAVLSPNSIAYAELFMGIIRAGACITPLSTMASPDALEKMLADCGARMLFLANQYRDLAAPFLDRLSAETVAIDFDIQRDMSMPTICSLVQEPSGVTRPPSSSSSNRCLRTTNDARAITTRS